MADLRRLTWFVVGVLLVAVPMLTWADDYAAPKWGYGRGPWSGFQYGGGAGLWGEYTSKTGGNAGVFADADTVCKQYNNGWSADPFTSEPSPGTFTRRCRRQDGSHLDSWVSQRWRCPSGGSLNTTTGICVGAPPCPEGESRNAEGVCVPPPCEAGQVRSEGDYETGPSPADRVAYLACHNGCTVAFSGYQPSGRELVGGVYRYFATGRYETTGDECTAGAGMPGTSEAMQNGPECAPLTQYLVTDLVTGEPRCVKVDTGEEANPHTPPDPTTTNTETTVTDNGDGSTTTTTTTTNSDGSTTTTTTTTQADGSSTSSTTTTPGTSESGTSGSKDPLTDYCGANPQAVICGPSKESGWSGGACGGAAPTCTGDAVQCAIARQSWDTNCALSASQEVIGYAEAMFGYEGTEQGSPLVPMEVDAGTWAIPDTGSGFGLVDKQFTVLGKQLTLPFSELNDFLRMFGWALMAVAWLIAYRIIREAL